MKIRYVLIAVVLAGLAYGLFRKMRGEPCALCDRVKEALGGPKGAAGPKGADTINSAPVVKPANDLKRQITVDKGKGNMVPANMPVLRIK